MRKLLIICGPTATGKTSVALSMAKRLGGELVSADSRQVYRDMDIGTGKDLPKNAKHKSSMFLPGHYVVGSINIWGYDLVSPKKEYSVAKYMDASYKIINLIWKKNHLPILVGGTGLYIKSVVDGIPSVIVPRNKDLRKNLEGRNVNELFEKLARLDPIKAGSMNTSDKKNPVRLIRAIEMAQWNVDKRNIPIKRKKTLGLKKNEVLFVGLKANKKILSKRIEKRVNKRVREGIEKEIENLKKSGVSWESQSMNSIGYKQWREYFEGKASKKKIIENWIREEERYAKRQMTWFYKNKRIKWFNISDKKYPENMEKYIERWYKETSETKKN